MKNCTRVRRTVLCLCVLLITFRLSAQSPFTHQQLKSSTGDVLGFLQYKPADYNQRLSTKYPIIIFLHGIGERGNGTTQLDNVSYVGMPRIIAKGHKMNFTWNGKTETFLVLAPQCPMRYGMWPSVFVDELIKYAKENLRVDTNRIYLTGLSMGGGGSLRFISDALPRYSSSIAAVATIAAPCTFRTGQYAANAHLPIWCFHAEDDRTASVNCTKAAVAGVNNWSPAVKPLMTLWPKGGHIVWDRVYTDTNYKYQGVLNIYEWFLGQNKSLPVNKLPVAAGNNVTITTGTAVAPLDASASTDADGKLVRFVWKKISGPAAGTITRTMGPAPATTVTGLSVPGVYQYEVTVVDDRAAFTSATVTVTVNPGEQEAPPPPPANLLPAARAGEDVAITLPLSTVLLNGSSSTDADGTIVSYSWTKISGPTTFILATPNAASTFLTNLHEGTYSFRLSVVDNKGGAASDTINVHVDPLIPPPANILPAANAGQDISVTLPLNKVTLNGNGSTDPDGIISSYSWSEISGPAAFTLADANASTTLLSNLQEGRYAFRLAVRDNRGGSDADTIIVQVTAPANILPVAKAGQDIVITLPLNKATINGNASTDADGIISTYSWSKISGPASFIISNPNAPSTLLGNLQEGTYAFRLAVTDNRGGSAADTINIRVNAAPPPPNVRPVADAGADRIITLPLSTAGLTGEASSDDDGSITTYSWTKVSGPNGGNLTNPSLPVTTATGLAEGKYFFRLLITDNDGDTDADTVMITVNAAAAPPPVPNKLPVAKANNDISITLPLNKVTLNGSPSNDPDGTITNYQWSKTGGPVQFRIASPIASVTEVTGLAEGIYTFRLQVKDNDGAISRDTVKVTVKPSPNTAPVADAGHDFEVVLPNPVIRLDGLGSADNDGSITSFSWTKVSGPTGLTITNSTTATPGVVGVKEGVYIFRLTVTDNHGAASTDDVKVTVLAAGAAPAPEDPYNDAPIADAGADQTIGLPENTTALDGSASHDDEGTIEQYSWRQVSGPTEAAINDPSAASTGVSDLAAGDYVFELTVTDNTGAGNLDSITVSVTSNMRYEQQLTVYPNPARSDLMVQMKSDTAGQVKISVYNVSGVLVRTFTAQKAQGEFRKAINVSGLQAGVYYVELAIGQKQRVMSRFIKD